jgi:branched-chain amino acid transport system permease protein
VNFAHGSLYMLGAYCTVSLAEQFAQMEVAGPLGFWGAVLIAGVAVALLGALLEMLLLRRLYAAPELLQLLATFALVLVVKDFALWAWGPEDLLGPRAPGLRGEPFEILRFADGNSAKPDHGQLGLQRQSVRDPIPRAGLYRRR